MNDSTRSVWQSLGLSVTHGNAEEINSDYIVNACASSSGTGASHSTTGSININNNNFNNRNNSNRISGSGSGSGSSSSSSTSSKVEGVLIYRDDIEQLQAETGEFWHLLAGIWRRMYKPERATYLFNHVTRNARQMLERKRFVARHVRQEMQARLTQVQNEVRKLNVELDEPIELPPIEGPALPLKLLIREWDEAKERVTELNEPGSDGE